MTTSSTPEPSGPGVVVVTGGASGLGGAVADAVDKAGGVPVVLDLAAPARDLDHELVDLSDGRAAEAAVQRAAERHGRFAAVVTAAGFVANGRFVRVGAWGCR